MFLITNKVLTVFFAGEVTKVFYNSETFFTSGTVIVKINLFGYC